MANKRAFAVVILLGCNATSAPPDEDEDQLSSADTSSPAIRSVRTDGGSRQVRQNAQATLVIRGNGLDTTTSITVGSDIAAINGVAPHEVTATVFVDSGVLGPLDVSAVTAAGTLTLTGALRATPFVVSPSGTGRGTFDDPMSLCELNNDGPGTTDTVKALAGIHQCDQLLFVSAGVTFEGAGRGTTIFQGTSDGGFGLVFAFAQAPATTTIRDLSFQDPLSSVAIELDTGDLLVERVTDTGGISATSGNVTLDHYTYDGDGTGLDLENGGATITHSTLRNCGTGDGISLGGNIGEAATLDHVTIENCARGLVMSGPRSINLAGGFHMTHSVLTGNGIGIQILDGDSIVEQTVIRDDATAQPSNIGIAMENGNLAITGGRITGQLTAGIQLFTQSFGDLDEQSRLTTDGIVIVGGPIGIDFAGLDISSSMIVRRSTIRQQTVASIRVEGFESRFDFGTLADPGGNALSVVSGGFAIDDARGVDTEPLNQYIQAVGTTLNGASFTGQTIDGPASLPPAYQILNFNNGIQF